MDRQSPRRYAKSFIRRDGLPSFPTIAALHAAYAEGLHPREVIEAAYRQLEALDDPGIFIALVPEADALMAADALGAFDADAMPLWGIPFAVKDNIDVQGLPTSAACPTFAYRPAATAYAVARLLAAGAILMGKTNLDQFATGLVGVRTPFPAPRNAIDAAVVPGGSSSGSAVAVSHGLVTFALGTDTAGSGRVPAGLNNVVGLKPSLGSVSSRGVVPACRTLDTISVFAGTVADADAAFRAMAGYDPLDPWSRPLPVAACPGDVPPALRVGAPDPSSRRFDGDTLSEGAFDETLADLRDMVGRVRAVDLAPMFAVAELLYDGPWVAERYQSLRELMETNPDALHPTTLAVISRAKAFSAADAFGARYRLEELRRSADELWREVDVLVVPTFPRPVTCAETEAGPFAPNTLLGTYTNFVNLLDLCALAVPGRFRNDGLPAGVTLIAPRGHDGLLAALGARLHATASSCIGAGAEPVPAPEPGPVHARPGEVEIAVVGAHMSGLPLNQELTSRGARYLRSTATTPNYRLHALPGGEPRRPGLLRSEAGGGSIDVEVWALPGAAVFGEFVSLIPAPLGIGTLELGDGTFPKGCVVEAAGLAGATDITRFGGWRGYLAHRERRDASLRNSGRSLSGVDKGRVGWAVR